MSDSSSSFLLPRAMRGAAQWKVAVEITPAWSMAAGGPSGLLLTGNNDDDDEDGGGMVL